MSSHSAPQSAPASAYPSTRPSVHAYSHANPIDLTLDDEEDGASQYSDRICKRPCTQSRGFDACREPDRLNTLDPSRHQPPYHSGLSPAMSSSSLDRQGYPNAAPDTRNGAGPLPAAPSSPSPFYQPQPITNGYFYPAMPLGGPSSASLRGSEPASHSRQVIDLTASPSPPPSVQPPTQSSMGNLPDDLPPKTPVCIGQLTATALILYPVPYLQAQGDGEWVPVRLGYEHNPNKPGGQETIHIKTPSVKAPTGEMLQGETFGVVEQKVAMTLGPMLGKGLIRLDAKVCRTRFHAPILSLQLLVYTPKGNITPVANYMQSNGLLLDHPSLQVDRDRLAGHYYHNPHNPPPGGHARAMASAHGRMSYPGPGGGSMGRWGNGVSGKSVEVQRSQVDELFKSLKTGDELEETEPTPDVATTLYPHQKKALTFLLERERELLGPSGKFSSLWQERRNPLTGERTWFHIVTQREIHQEPFEPRGSILADDMGLGKTITCVSLIAATVPSSRQFGATPLPPLPPPPEPTPDPGLSPAHFQGSVWGIPEGGSSSSSVKSKQKAAREQERADVEYVRASRIRAKSRATLVICPLSTVVNWEDQFKEHWRGEVVIVGGAGGACISTQGGSSMAPPTFIMTSMSAPVPQQIPHYLALAPETKAFIAAAPSPAFGRTQGSNALRVYVYHGNARRPDPAFLADFDVVITTYSTLASEFSKQVKSTQCADDDEDDVGSEGDADDSSRSNTKKALKKRKKVVVANGVEATSPLQSVYWFRVVLDEAHSIKETSTVACRACCDLMAERRLCLTGTPVQNKLDDVYALIKFLRLSPLDDKNTWTEFIGTPVKYGQPLGFARIQTIMKCITLRRTKESRTDDGQKILSLPPRRDEIRYLKFDEQEQSIYDQFFQESKEEFNELSHKNEVMKNYVGILQKILRLRQICDHYELVQNKGLGLVGDAQYADSATAYEDVVATVSREGINAQRAATIFSLLRESGLTQCVECGYDLAPQLEVLPGEGGTDADTPATPKRGRKPKAATSRASTRQNSPTNGNIIPVLTRCQHLFCIMCFRNSIHPNWPNVSPDQQRCCSTCQTALLPTDAVEVNAEQSSLDILFRKKNTKKEKRIKGSASAAEFRPSTKIRALLDDLQECSKLNPHSVNYDPNAVEIMMVDNQGNSLDNGIVKTVVFSQWTSMLDKIEDGLELARIRYNRLDGTMKREDRTRAMDALKNDPGCEVLLVSLKAGGVGLNLTAAQRVYLMDPYWNPAVENQAVDRIHRLGQTRPVQTIKFIIENSIEARLLEVQRKKTELANMTLGQNFTKAEMLQRRMEELNQLFGG